MLFENQTVALAGLSWPGRRKGASGWGFIFQLFTFAQTLLSLSFNKIFPQNAKTNKVGNPFVFHTLAFDKSTGNDDGRTGNKRDRSEGDLVGVEEFLMEEEEFLMYYSAGSTHLADSNIDEPLYLGLGQ